MRKLILSLFVAMALLTAACSKDSTKNADIVGTWIATEYLVSPGPMGEWQPWNTGAYVAIFHDDGRLELTKPFLSLAYDRYKVIDDNTLRLYRSATPDSADLTYSIDGGELTLWLMCIEPCGIKFKRPAK